MLHSLRGLQHVVPSWGAGDFATESRWTGTRDYAAMRAVPAALAYLQDWRSADGLTAPEFNRVGLRRAVDDCPDVVGLWTLRITKNVLDPWAWCAYPRASTYLRTYRDSRSAPTPSDRGCATATASKLRSAVSRTGLPPPLARGIYRRTTTRAGARDAVLELV